jgi:molecular chaperone GrpE
MPVAGMLRRPYNAPKIAGCDPLGRIAAGPLARKAAATGCATGVSGNSDQAVSEENKSQEAAPEDAEPREAEGEGNGAPAPASTADAAEAAAADLTRLKDQLLRMAADFDNYRKRSRRDLQEAERRAQEDLVKALLPTFDNLERASEHTESAADLKSLMDGLQMVQRQFKDALAGLGIERVGEVGVAFDPAEHEAVQNVETAEFPVGAVARVLQPGYRWKGRLMRPALVVVARAPSGS